MTKQVRKRINQNQYVSKAEGAALGLKVRDGVTLAQEMAAIDALPPLLRQHLNESVIEWSAVTVLKAYHAHARACHPFSEPDTLTPEQQAKITADIVLWLGEQDERLVAACTAEQNAAILGRG